MAWSDVKDDMEAIIAEIASGSSFGIRQVQRDDGSVTTYSSMKEMLEAYDAVCVLASKEELGRKSIYRPIAVRKGGFRQ